MGNPTPAVLAHGMISRIYLLPSSMTWGTRSGPDQFFECIHLQYSTDGSRNPVYPPVAQRVQPGLCSPGIVEFDGGFLAPDERAGDSADEHLHDAGDREFTKLLPHRSQPIAAPSAASSPLRLELRARGTSPATWQM